MAEKEIENQLVDTLQKARQDPALLKGIAITNSTSASVQHLGHLCGNVDYDVFQDDSHWNTYPKLMPDVIGGMTPDIVIRSSVSRENRIIIEVKESGSMNYGVEDSQVIRYFLHLLATSQRHRKASEEGKELQRAVLLAAPSSWFEDPKTSPPWNYFLDRYTDLATAFGICLGELRQ